MATRLGTLDQINVAIRPRGGGTPLGTWRALPMDGAGFELIENDTSTSKFIIPAGGLISPAGVILDRRVLEEVAAWRHEVQIVAGGTVGLEGPITDAKMMGGGIKVESGDFTAWWQKRPVKAIDLTADIVDVFAAINGSAMEDDQSPNFGIHAYPSGLTVTRRIDADDYRMAGDVLRELARTGANWIGRGRTIHVRGPIIGSPSFALTDRDLIGEPVVHKPGKTQANRVYVTGKSGAVGFAEDTASQARDGLLVRHFTENTIPDESLNAAAASRLAQLANPIHLIIPNAAQISPHAPVTFGQLLPGNIGTITIGVNMVPITRTFRVAKLKVGFDGSVRATFSPVNEELIL